MCPGLFFFHGDRENMRGSIVDPHGHHLSDALLKLRGLAEFAATHGESFHRIESAARMKDCTLRVLDLTDPVIQKAIREPMIPRPSTLVTRPTTIKALSRHLRPELGAIQRE